jgi:hypothetical protein
LTWPNVTLLGFEITSYEAIVQGGVDSIRLLPILRSAEKLAEWNAYTSSPASPAASWVNMGRHIYAQSNAGSNRDFLIPSEEGYVTPQIIPYVYNPLESTASSNASRISGVGFPAPIDPSTTPPPYMPSWQVSPPPSVDQTRYINMDMYRFPLVAHVVEALFRTALDAPHGLMSPFMLPSSPEADGSSHSQHDHEERALGSDTGSAVTTVLLHFDRTGEVEYTTVTTSNSGIESVPLIGHENNHVLPHSFYLEPVFDRLFDRNSTVRAVVMASLHWEVFLANVMFRSTFKRTIGNPEAPLIDVVLRNNCNQSYTFRVLSPEVCIFFAVLQLSSIICSY